MIQIIGNFGIYDIINRFVYITLFSRAEAFRTQTVNNKRSKEIDQNPLFAGILFFDYHKSRSGRS